MSIDHTSKPTALFIAVIVTVLWSSSWVLIRWGLDTEALEPVTFASLRYGLAAAVLLVWVVGRTDHRSTIRSLDRGSIVTVLVLGVVFYALTQGAQFVAIDTQPAATTSLVLSLTPILVAVLAGRSIAEKSSPRQALGAAIVAAGAWAYFAGDLGATAAGMLAALVALGANVASALFGRHINRSGHVAPVVVTALSMGVGAVMLVAAGLTIEGVPSVSFRAWLIIAWLALVNTALAFTLWNRALRQLSAVEAAAINNTMLIQIALLGWWFLDEPLAVGEALGIGLVTVGVLLTQTVVRLPRLTSRTR